MLYCFHAFLSLSLLPRVNEILFSLPCFSVNGDIFSRFIYNTLVSTRVKQKRKWWKLGSRVEKRIVGVIADSQNSSNLDCPVFSRRVILSFYYRFAIQSRCRLMRYDSEYNGILAVTAAPITPTNLEIVISPRWRRRHRSIPNRSLVDVNFDDYGSRCASSAQ